MKKTHIIFIFFVLLVFSAVKGFSQYEIDSTRLYHLETVDGNKFTGNVIRDDGQILEFNNGKFGIVKIPKSAIKKIARLDKQNIRSGKIWLENPQSTRHFWAPNGYGLKKGEGYYQNIWVLWNQASYGVTDYFSVGVGIIPLFLFGSDISPMFVLPKFSIPVVNNKFNIGAGVLAGTAGFNNQAGFGLAYGVATMGSKNNNLSLGLGYGYADSNWASKPLINISGMARISSGTYFLTENYFLNIDGKWVGLVSLGARSLFNKVGLDYGLFFPVTREFDGFLAFPWLGLTIPFFSKI
ncbi:MAG: hypothetical protein ACM3PT_13465 [Deltaproteobacteria bacterium]